MFEEIKSLNAFYKNRKELSALEILEDYDIDDVLLKKSFIDSSSVELDKQVFNYNNSINLKEANLKSLEESKKEFVCSFENAVFINTLKLVTENYFYDNNNLTDFKITLITEVGDVLNINMLPFNYAGEYSEKIKFSDGQSKSLFSAKKNTKFACFYQNSEIDSETIINGFDNSNKIIFKTDHKYDDIVIEYVPEGKEYIKSVGALVKLIKVTTDINFEEKQLKLLMD